MASRKIEDCDIRLQQVWQRSSEKWNSEHEVKVFLTCTQRNADEQNALYAQGRTADGHVVTNAKAYESPHNFDPSYAFDVGFKNPDGSLNWETANFIKFAALIHLIDETIVWGGNFHSIKDLPHYEKADWRNLVV